MKQLTTIVTAIAAIVLATACPEKPSPGANNNNNSNTQLCGDGVVGLGEQCDDGEINSDTEPNACRTDCRSAHCGDRIVDASEVCDRDNLDGLTCADASGFDAGDLACSDTCELVTSACTLCGDGVKEGTEDCDGLDVGTSSCSSLAAGQHGTLRCTGACVYDTAGCHTCDNGLLESAEDCEMGQLPTCAQEGYTGGTRQCIQCAIFGACDSVCGNGIVEPDETCDGLDKQGETCGSQGFWGGPLSCSPSCQLNTADCSQCGDGIIDSDEDCDGSNIGGVDCAAALGAVGFTGSPGCRGDCHFDLSLCVAPAGCGNGLVEAAVGEQCDGTDLGGLDCDQLPGGLFGGGTLACNGNCTLDVFGCLWANPCGNGLREPAAGEQCDDTDLGGESCADHGFPGGSLACSSLCTFDTSGCSAPPDCGNDQIDAGELCDGSELGGQTCAGLGFVSGTLSCTAQCTLESSGCSLCGNDQIDPGEICDGTGFGTASCADYGYYLGSLSCGAGCDVIGSSGCSGFCGDDQINGPESCDGSALGGLSCSDFGFTFGSLGCDVDCGQVSTTGCSTGICFAGDDFDFYTGITDASFLANWTIYSDAFSAPGVDYASLSGGLLELSDNNPGAGINTWISAVHGESICGDFRATVFTQAPHNASCSGGFAVTEICLFPEGADLGAISSGRPPPPYLCWYAPWMGQCPSWQEGLLNDRGSGNVWDWRACVQDTAWHEIEFERLGTNFTVRRDGSPVWSGTFDATGFDGPLRLMLSDISVSCAGQNAPSYFDWVTIGPAP